jgi:hypothetical protein
VRARVASAVRSVAIAGRCRARLGRQIALYICRTTAVEVQLRITMRSATSDQYPVTAAATWSSKEILPRGFPLIVRPMTVQLFDSEEGSRTSNAMFRVMPLLRAHFVSSWTRATHVSMTVLGVLAATAALVASA